MNEAAVKALITDWIDVKCSWVIETAGNIEAGIRDTVDDACVRTLMIGLDWDDSLIPQHIRDDLERWYLDG